MTNPARKMQREALRQNRKAGEKIMRAQQGQAPPPSTGAIDLGAMKGDKRKQQEVADNVLKQQGFMCSCGEKFGEESIQAMGYNLGRFPQQQIVMTPHGPQQQTTVDDGCQFFVANFCSRHCVDFLDALKNGLEIGEEARAAGVVRPKIRAIRALPKIEWLEESTVEVAAWRP